MKYNKILLKLSGESVGGPDGNGLDKQVLTSYAKQIRRIVDAGCRVGIVIGGAVAISSVALGAVMKDMTAIRVTRWGCSQQ